ncbi:MAG TPA: glycosyltransferase [Syntrophales bacterium]|nr:glycosyltransferase [Syntrophales bacterium]
MRILVVGAIQGGTVPICHAIHRAFTDIGQQSDLLDFSEFQKEYFETRNDDERFYQFHLKIKIFLLEKVAGFQPDVIFGIAQSPLYDTDMLAGFKKAGITLCFWFMEDYRVFSYWGKIAPYFDHFFTIQKDPFWKELKDAGCMNYSYLPMAFDMHADCAGIEREGTIPASFVGAPYPNRVHFFSTFLNDGFQIYGEDWNRHKNPWIVTGDRRITKNEAYHIYRRSLININLHSSTFPGEFGGGDFVNPRTFELAGLGAFQLTDMRKLLTLHFDPAEEVIALASWADMKGAVKYFLRHDEERKTFAEKARARVLKEHTYRRRAEEIIEVLGK